MIVSTSELAEILYERYCSAVGGKAFNGDALPDWRKFYADSNKAKQVTGWLSVAQEAVDQLNPIDD